MTHFGPHKAAAMPSFVNGALEMAIAVRDNNAVTGGNGARWFSTFIVR